jgi:hypothetical protein
VYHKTASTGFTERIDNFEDKIPEFDPRSGDHFWIVITTYKVDPNNFLAGESLLDHESLVGVSVPGCYFCEEVYTPRMLHRRCIGLR